MLPHLMIVQLASINCSIQFICLAIALHHFSPHFTNFTNRTNRALTLPTSAQFRLCYLHRNNANMAHNFSDIAAFFEPALCANIEQEVDGAIAPCQKPATQVCSGCRLVQVRRFGSRFCIVLPSPPLITPSIARRTVRLRIGNVTRRRHANLHS